MTVKKLNRKSVINERLAQSRVMPIIVCDEVDLALSCVEKLAAAGLDVVEVTLRTPNALSVLREVVSAFPQVLVGAGTVLNRKQMNSVQDVGAAFAISPGITPELANAALLSSLPFYPGVSSASDLMLALENDLDVVKLFPSDLLGGAKMAKALGGPFPDVKFCLTGGINTENLAESLKQKNVLCVGGSWMCNAELLKQKDWDRVSQLAHEAYQISRV